MEEKTRQAFKVTMKKLDKLNAPVADEFKEDLERERLDQVRVGECAFVFYTFFDLLLGPFLMQKREHCTVFRPPSLPGRHRMADKIE